MFSMQLKCIHLKGIIVQDLKENLILDTKKYLNAILRATTFDIKQFEDR